MAGGSRELWSACLQEWLYRDEFEGYEKEGVLQMHTAFSREQAGNPKHALFLHAENRQVCQVALLW